MAVHSLIPWHRRKTSSTSRTNSQTLSKALLLPEILFIVFSFSSQHALSTSIRFVCKQWLYVANPMIHIQALWKDRPSANYNYTFLLKRLHTVTHLRVLFQQQWTIRNTEYAWRELLETIDTLEKSNRLRIFVLIINGANFLESRIYPLLSKLHTTLTEIRIERIVQVQDMILLGVILALCPSLVRLYIESISNPPVIVAWDVTDKGTVHSRIESLIIKGLRVVQENFIFILKRCPNLRILKLVQIAASNLDQIGGFDESRFYSDVIATCPTLELFHFSRRDQNTSEAGARNFIDSFHQLGLTEPERTFIHSNWVRYIDMSKFTTKLSIVDSIFRPGLLDFICGGHPLSRDRIRYKIITTLELEPSIDMVGLDSRFLHLFLCSAPALQHLVAPKATINTEWLAVDKSALKNTLFNSNSNPNSNSNSSSISNSHYSLSPVWLCRRLKTLIIQFHTLSADEHFYKESRKIFGYIVQRCPELEVLSIFHNDLDLRLSGGFNLLSKLVLLERVTVQSNSKCVIGIKDVEWMTRYQQQKYWIPFRDYSRSGNQTERSLEEAGCWPYLEYLKIQGGVEKATSKYLQKIRPAVKISIDSKYLKKHDGDAVLRRRK